jgi:hypothetical protein
VVRPVTGLCLAGVAACPFFGIRWYPPDRALVGVLVAVVITAYREHRGRNAGPLAGLDAALALLRDLLSFELLLLPDSGGASGMYRIDAEPCVPGNDPEVWCGSRRETAMECDALISVGQKRKRMWLSATSCSSSPHKDAFLTLSGHQHRVANVPISSLAPRL